VISVLIATFNGADTLPLTLDALTRLEAPRGGWRLLVVDNGSTEATPSILRSFANRLPLDILRQPHPGKSSALNLGLDHCDGDLVVFTDDDVVPQPDWLVAYRAAADGHPDVDVFSGPIKPHWSVIPPDYVLRHVPVGATYGVSDPSLVEGPLRRDLVWGANMAVRGTVAAVHRFDPELGPRGRCYRSGEDDDYVLRLANRGHRIWHVPAAGVAHIIGRHQVRRSWLLSRAASIGRAVYHHRLAQRPYRHAFGVPLFAVRGLAGQLLRLGGALAGFNDAEMFAAEWNMAFLVGHILEAWDTPQDRASGGDGGAAA
jgi:L-malate glycosyltransferase